jgi:hypothetical protein
MRFLVLCVLASSFLVAPAHAVDGDDPSLSIEAGRLGVMMDQSTEALKLLAPNAKDTDLGPPEAQRAYAFEELVTAVLRYNVVAHEACRRSLVSATLCVGPFLPAWLKDGAAVDHSDASLREMVDETTGRLMPFWSAMCEKGRKASGDDFFCAIE